MKILTKSKNTTIHFFYLITATVFNDFDSCLILHMRFVRLDSDFTLVLVYIFLNAEEITKYTIILKFTDLLGLIY